MESGSSIPRGFIDTRPGSRVLVGGVPHTIVSLTSAEELLVREDASDRVTVVHIRHLKPVPEKVDEDGQREGTPDPVTVSPERWAEARRRHELLKPYFEGVTGAELRQILKAAGVHRATYYRWARRFERTGQILSLIPESSGQRAGSARVRDEVEAIIKSALDKHYLTHQRPRIQSTCNEIIRRCRAAGLRPPHHTTIRRRISNLSERVVLRRRHGAKVAAGKFRPVQRQVLDPPRPLALFQIDHTELDLVLVDDIARLPVGRPWLTMAIDVFSRMVAGLCVTFDKPNELSVGLCMAHAISPKDAWLASLGLSGSSWPIWGVPEEIHADNGKEFKGATFQRSCENYGIKLVWDPPGAPRYKGHIERLLGTFMQEVHEIPGTTFSNVAEKGSYNSDGKAIMTLRECEKWITTFTTDVYHQRVHKEIGMPPVRKYEEAILGTSKKPGLGLPRRPIDEERIRLDFLPLEERTVQSDGIALDGIHYLNEVLSPWINAMDPKKPRLKRRFLVRRDPRNVSFVYFFDPELKEYFPITCHNLKFPPMSLWDLRALRVRALTDGKEVNERVITEGYTRMRELEATSKRKTRAARRAEQRRRDHEAGCPSPPPSRRQRAEKARPATAERVQAFADLEEIGDDGAD